jgi:O-antigen/teichoic acid export membrane protein
MLSHTDVNTNTRSMGTLLKKAAVLLTGSVCAQLVPFAVLPILSRLYSPEAFGNYAAFMLAAGLCGAVVTGRYELAVLLPRNPRRASAVTCMGVGLVITLSLILFALLLIGFYYVQLVPSTWLIALPLTVAVVGLAEFGSYVLNRKERYASLSQNMLLMQLASAAGKIGCASLGSTGLLWGHAAGRFVGLLPLWRQLTAECQRIYQNRKRQLGYLSQVAWYYRAFPLYNIPHSLLTNFSGGFLAVFLLAFGRNADAGYVALCRTLLFSPMAVLSVSLGRVFFREAALSLGTEAFTKLTRRLMQLLAEFATPGLALLVWFSPQLFPLLMGQQWAQAGTFCSVMAVVGYCLAFTSWPERIFEVAGKQRVVFLLQLVADLINMAVVYLLLAGGGSSLVVVQAFTVCAVLYHVAYLWFIYSYAGMPVTALIALGASILMSLGSSLFILVLLSLVLDSVLIQFCLALLCMVAWWAWRALNLRSQLSKSVP